LDTIFCIRFLAVLGATNIENQGGITMDVREKLDKLLSKWLAHLSLSAADDLIANGVTVQEWISVDERKPDLIPCGAGTAYSEAVNVLTDGRKVLTAIWNGSYWICDAEFWDAEFEEITHWTPVLLPLPEPPKGE
jgi:hypothetical protein